MTKEAQAVVDGFKRLNEMEQAEAYMDIDSYWRELARKEQAALRAGRSTPGAIIPDDPI
jgi:hypothetical protein